MVGHEAILYEAIGPLFEEADGSLPEVQIDGITADEAQVMLDVLLELAEPLRPEQTVWDDAREAPMPIADYPDAGRRAADGRLTALHFVLTGLRSRETDLPDLGVSIWRGVIALDYHGGAQWSPPVLSVFVELLCALRDLSADGQLLLADEVSTALPAKQQEHFREAVRRYRAAVA